MLQNQFAIEVQTVATVLLSALVMYATIMVFARMAGVRSFAQMSTFDIAITIAIGSTVGATMVVDKPMLLQGVFSVATLYALHLGVSKLRHRFRAVEQSVDNRPILLMSAGGRMLTRNMQVARVTTEDLRSKLRQANVQRLSTVRAVVMEGTGEVHVLHGDTADEAPDPWLLEGVRNYEDEPAIQESTAEPNSSKAADA